MNKKTIVYAVFVLMIAVGLGSSFQCKADNPIPPLHNPLRPDFTWTPDPGYYKDTIQFTGSCTGGQPPYNYTWTVPDQEIQWGEEVEFTFEPTSSPTDYPVRLTVRDSTEPNPYWKNKTQDVEIRILYDIYIQEVDTDIIWFIPDDVIASFTIKNKGDLGICPRFDVEFRIYTHHLIWQTREPTNFSNTYERRSDLDPGQWVSERINIENPGEPPAWHCYVIRAEITNAPYDNDYTWKHVD
jgi:hypothetical protein